MKNVTKFKDQTVYLASEGISEFKAVLSSMKLKKVLLVTGKMSYQRCGAQALLTPILEGLDVARFSNFDVNPKLEDVYRGIDLLDEFKAELIIAVGGGSAMDMAKLLSMLVYQDRAAYQQLILGELPLIAKSIPLVAIPTTSGTGSEATHFAVVYVNNKKYSLADPLIKPQYVILAPDLTKNVPSKITAATAFDALSQAIESFWAVSATPQSTDYAVKAIQLLFANLVKAVCEPNGMVLRSMMLGAYYAGKAIDISKTTACHAFSYSLTSNFAVPHGHAVALSLGKVLLLNCSVSQESQINSENTLVQHLDKMSQLLQLLGGGTAQQCSDLWYKMMSDTGLENSLAALGLASQANIQLITSEVNLQRMTNHPIKLTDESITNIW